MEQNKPTQVELLRNFNLTVTNEKTKDYLSQVLGTKASQFVNNVTALVANDTKLQACKPMSVIYAAIKATALDLPLDPSLGFAYVIPYNNKGQGMEAQFQLGYKGFIQLAIRSGQFQRINVTDVREGEIVGHDRMTGDITYNWLDDSVRDSKAIIGYAAYYRLNKGFEKSLYMSQADIEKHATQYSKTYASNLDYVRTSSKWTTDRDAMAKKTVLKLLLSRFAPLSIQMLDGIKQDQQVFSEISDEGKYVDNPQPTYTDYDDLSVEEKMERMRKAQEDGTNSAPVLP